MKRNRSDLEVLEWSCPTTTMPLQSLSRSWSMHGGPGHHNSTAWIIVARSVHLLRVSAHLCGSVCQRHGNCNDHHLPEYRWSCPSDLDNYTMWPYCRFACELLAYCNRRKFLTLAPANFCTLQIFVQWGWCHIRTLINVHGFRMLLNFVLYAKTRTKISAITVSKLLLLIIM